MYLRSDNGPEFIEKTLKRWLAKNGTDTIHIEPGKPWQNGFIESFTSKVRDEFLNMEVFYTPFRSPGKGGALAVGVQWDTPPQQL